MRNLAALAADPDCNTGNKVNAIALAVRGIMDAKPDAAGLKQDTDFHLQYFQQIRKGMPDRAQMVKILSHSIVKADHVCHNEETL